jgi:hypothetical protein
MEISLQVDVEAPVLSRNNSKFIQVKQIFPTNGMMRNEAVAKDKVESRDLTSLDD